VAVANRVIIVVVALAALAGAVVTLLVSVGASPPDLLPHGWFETQLKTVADASGAAAVGIMAVCVVIILAMIAILVVESAPLRRPMALLISSTEQGVTTIDEESICVLCERTSAGIHSVHAVKCHIRERPGGLLIVCRPTAIMGSNLLELGPELQQRIKEAVEELTGLPVAQVDVSFKYEPVEARRLAVR